MLETHVEENTSRIILRDKYKNYNNSPLHNRKNAKSNQDIDEVSEGKFPLTI